MEESASSMFVETWLATFLMPPIPIVLRCSFLFLWSHKNLEGLYSLVVQAAESKFHLLQHVLLTKVQMMA
ncbi:hypothetical protein DAI22_04g135500 [Oryza sativa Japonica Group]|jgi:hypothetical protein|nr:hypothetical protein DAI22_04g135500 [Oryza sativa Japonica Group]